MPNGSWLYDLCVWFLTLVVSLFFREIRQRGAHKIPKTGPVIFVVAPHANQFVDPLILLRECRRRVGFLCAAKTMDRKYVGAFAKAVNSIPVARAQDLAKHGTGRVVVKDRVKEPTHLVGSGTKFTAEFNVGDSITLPQAGTAEISEIISDLELVVKKDLTKDLPSLELLTRNEGSTFKCLPRVDQGAMYQTVYDRLNAGECIGIFPEGGSHDRFEMLPLKAGVCIMALGAMAEHPGLDVKIVPCGLNYFHPHKFRSRAVVEFGDPITIPHDFVNRFVQGGTEKREACGKLLEVIYQALKTVTVNAGDYETLMVIQAGRRLYRPSNKKLTTAKVLELNRRFVAAYQHLRDKPEVKEIKDKVMAYNKMLKYHALRDHQVKKTQVGGPRALVFLVYRIISLSGMALVALPGAILNSPIALIAKIISYRKAKEALAASTVKIAGRDVLATWKLLVALVLVPLFYWTYAFIVLMIVAQYDVSFMIKVASPFITLGLLPFISYASLRFGETSLDIFRSLRPLFLSLFPSTAGSVRNLQTVREELSKDLTLLINRHAPEFVPPESERIITQEETEQSSRPVTPGTLARLQWLTSLTSLPTAVTGAIRPILDDSIFNWSDVSNDDTADDVFFFQRGATGDADLDGSGNVAAFGSGSISGSSTPASSTSGRSRSSSFGEGLSITSITSMTPLSLKFKKRRPHASGGDLGKTQASGSTANGSATSTAREHDRGSFSLERRLTH